MNGRVLVIIPTPKTRRLADVMVRAAETTTGHDAALQYLKHVEPAQIPALVGVLLTATKQHKKVGRTPLPITYSRKDQLKAKARYKAGHRDEWTVEGRRQYERVMLRQRTARSQAAR